MIGNTVENDKNSLGFHGSQMSAQHVGRIAQFRDRLRVRTIFQQRRKIAVILRKRQNQSVRRGIGQSLLQQRRGRRAAGVLRRMALVVA